MPSIESRNVQSPTLVRLWVPRAISVRVGVVDHQEEGLVARLGEELGDALSDELHIQGIDVVPPAVVELERIAGVDVELTDDPGSVAGAFKDVGDGGVSQVWVQAEDAASGEPVLAVRVWIKSGEHGAARRAAGGLRDVGDIEPDAARGEGVEMGSFDDGVTVATELEAEVVGGDEQDVGPSRCIGTREGTLRFFSADLARHQQERCNQECHNFHCNSLLRNLNLSPNLNPASHISRSGEFARIHPTSIETISTSEAFPSSAFVSSIFFLATKTSRHAAHSNAEPLAVSKNLQRSAGVCFPFPSAMFKGTDVEARSNWLCAAMDFGTDSKRSSAHATKRIDSW